MGFNSGFKGLNATMLALPEVV